MALALRGLPLHLLLEPLLFLLQSLLLPLINLGTSLSLAGARAIHSSLHALLLGFNHDKLGNNFRHLWRQQRAPQSPRQCDAAYISAAVSKSLFDQHARAGHHISITEMRVAYDARRSDFLYYPVVLARVFLQHTEV
jgi:hypothetical protein